MFPAFKVDILLPGLIKKKISIIEESGQRNMLNKRVPEFRNYKTKSYNSETICKDLTYIMTFHITTWSGSLS